VNCTRNIATAPSASAAATLTVAAAPAAGRGGGGGLRWVDLFALAALLCGTRHIRRSTVCGAK
jgi:hypothetical protein